MLWSRSDENVTTGVAQRPAGCVVALCSGGNMGCKEGGKTKATVTEHQRGGAVTKLLHPLGKSLHLLVVDNLSSLGYFAVQPRVACMTLHMLYRKPPPEEGDS